uniref:Uncharacterized protein n=1 Tax=viral metagenome TaxID=1070528 RepID=A0A6M3L7Q5_9ZZZZ
MDKKEIIKKKTYKIEFMEYSDETSRLSRECDGFEAFELLGLLYLIKDEILTQIRGKIKPDIIERKVIRRKQ